MSQDSQTPASQSASGIAGYNNNQYRHDFMSYRSLALDGKKELDQRINALHQLGLLLAGGGQNDQEKQTIYRDQIRAYAIFKMVLALCKNPQTEDNIEAVKEAKRLVQTAEATQHLETPLNKYRLARTRFHLYLLFFPEESKQVTTHYIEALQTLLKHENTDNRLKLKLYRQLVFQYLHLFQQLGGKRPRLFPQFYRGARSQSALATQGEHSHTPLENPHALLPRGQAPEISFVKASQNRHDIGKIKAFIQEGLQIEPSNRKLKAINDLISPPKISYPEYKVLCPLPNWVFDISFLTITGMIETVALMIFAYPLINYFSNAVLYAVTMTFIGMLGPFALVGATIGIIALGYFGHRLAVKAYLHIKHSNQVAQAEKTQVTNILKHDKAPIFHQKDKHTQKGKLKVKPLFGNFVEPGVRYPNDIPQCFKKFFPAKSTTEPSAPPVSEDHSPQY